MSRYYGDFRAGQVVRCRFNTVNASGAPATLTAGAVVVSKDGADVTPSGGVTLTTDAGGVTGRHAVVIDLSADPSVFTAGSDYAARLSGSSAVGAVSVVGAVVGEWSIASRAVAVDPAGRPTSLISAGTGTGQINVSGGKVPATLASTDVAGNLPADLQTIKTQTVTAAAGVTFPAAVGTSTYGGADTAGTTSLLALAGGGNGFAAIKGDSAAIKARTDNLPAAPADETLIISATNAIMARLGTPATTSIAADIATRSTYAGGAVTIADGSITSAKFTVSAPSAGLPSGILEKIDRVFRRFFKKADRTTTQLKTYADDGTTVLTTQAVSDDGAGNESQGAAS